MNEPRAVRSDACFARHAPLVCAQAPRLWVGEHELLIFDDLVGRQKRRQSNGDGRAGGSPNSWRPQVRGVQPRRPAAPEQAKSASTFRCTAPLGFGLGASPPECGSAAKSGGGRALVRAGWARTRRPVGATSRVGEWAVRRGRGRCFDGGQGARKTSVAIPRAISLLLNIREDSLRRRSC